MKSREHIVNNGKAAFYASIWPDLRDASYWNDMPDAVIYNEDIDQYLNSKQG